MKQKLLKASSKHLCPLYHSYINRSFLLIRLPFLATQLQCKVQCGLETAKAPWHMRKLLLAILEYLKSPIGRLLETILFSTSMLGVQCITKRPGQDFPIVSQWSCIFFRNDNRFNCRYRSGKIKFIDYFYPYPCIEGYAAFEAYVQRINEF